MSESETPTEWRELQKRWRAILFDLPQAACVHFIRETVLKSDDAFVTLTGTASIAMFKRAGRTCGITCESSAHNSDGNKTKPQHQAENPAPPAAASCRSF